MGKPTICIGENKGADQLHSNCEADQRLCFRYTDCTIHHNFGSDQVQRKQACTVTEAGQNLEILDLGRSGIVLSV